MAKTFLELDRSMLARYKTFAWVSAIVLLIAAVLYFGRESDDGDLTDSDPNLHSQSIPSSEAPDAVLSAATAIPEREGNNGNAGSPPELFRSVYDDNLADSSRLLSAGERLISGTFPDEGAYIRWGILQIDTSILTNGTDVSDKNLLPAQIRLRPFEHVAFDATLTEHRPQTANNMALWEGSVDGDPESSVRFTAVGRPDRVSFVARVISHSGHFVFVESDIPLTYVVIEVNPTFVPDRG